MAPKVVDDPKPLAPEYANAVGPPCEPPDVAPSIRSRTDRGLREAYESHLRAPRAPDAGISVSLRFCGELASILALGVEPMGAVWEPGSVSVIVRYRDLPRVVQHSHVVYLSAGSPKSYR